MVNRQRRNAQLQITCSSSLYCIQHCKSYGAKGSELMCNYVSQDNAVTRAMLMPIFCKEKYARPLVLCPEQHDGLSQLQLVCRAADLCHSQGLAQCPAVEKHCAAMQAGGLCLFEDTAVGPRPVTAPTIAIRVPEGPVAEACIHGQWLAGTGPGCHCLHEETGASQVSTAQVTHYSARCCRAMLLSTLKRLSSSVLDANSTTIRWNTPSWC